MAQRRMGSLALEKIKVVLVIGFVIGLLTGCSSQLRTTTVSGSEASKVQMTQLEPETVTVEEVVAQPVQKETKMVIPVEEPARRAPRSELPAEIFATPKSTVASSEISPFSEAPTLVPADSPIASSIAAVSEPAMQRPAAGIPPISFEPELPALPTLNPDEISPTPQDSPVEEPQVVSQAHVPTAPAPSTEKEPIQLAKVMPQEPATVEITTETLEAALNDIYFDYDRFSIRDDAMPLLKVNAQLLTAKFADKHIVIEGHCDERGTQSYNMVLGERRAYAVKRFLEDLGVPAENLQAVSYGKDKPFCSEPTQECWQENRRGHFLIQ